MVILIMSLLIVACVTLAIPLMEMLLIFGLNILLHQIKTSGLVNVVKQYFERRAERKAFWVYLSAVVTSNVSPVLIDIVLNFQHSDTQVHLNAQILSDNTFSISLTMSILATIGYMIYAYIKTSNNRTIKQAEIIKILSVINEELIFKPNQQWFNEKAINTIASLHKRYDKDHNIIHPELPLILSVLNRDKSTKEFFRDDIDLLIEKTSFLIKDIDPNIQEQVNVHLEHLVTLMNKDLWDEPTVSVVKELIDTIHTIMDEWFNKIPRENRNKVLYKWDQYQEVIERITKALTNSWVECIYKQVMLVSGPGGIGKSHLLGNIVDERVKHNNPTIFILGSFLSEGHDPWSQILERLDLKCKKEAFFNGLNEYSEKTGERIQIVIDAINESKGGLNYWANNIYDFTNAIKKYPNLGLILSIRTTNYNGAFDEYLSDTSHANYEVTGFTNNLTQACEYMFDSFGLTTPTWAVVDVMFKNPLWLRMYCTSHAMLNIDSTRENHWQIVERYIEGFNELLARKLEYNKERNLLQKALFAIAGSMIDSGKFHLFSYEDAYKSISDSIGDDVNVKLFLNELLQFGILRQETFKDDLIIGFEYEILGNFIVTYKMISDYPNTKWIDHLWRFSEEIAEIVPLITNHESWIYFSGRYANQQRNAFIDTLLFRNTLTEDALDFLDAIWQSKNYKLIFRVILNSATNTQIQYNSSKLYDLLFHMDIVERDSIWTTVISEYNELRDTLYNTSTWLMNASAKTIDALDITSSRLLAELLIWSLASTYARLRDTSTKALVNLLRNKQELLNSLINKYYTVNDLYIVERVWAAAFGCCAQNRDPKYVENIAILAHKYVFDIKPIVEHILIRDYALLIIQYAISLGSKVFENDNSYLPPYNEYIEIPYYSDEFVIENYENPCDKYNDKQIYTSLISILNSMAVEYSRKGIGGYGDFGRYTFQYALSVFPENPNDLSNWGLNIIFDEIGYDPTLVKAFDSNIRMYDSHNWERIGKKYQWLALYKIAAILSDYHDIYHQQLDGNDNTSAVKKLRNIDPTVLNINPSIVSQINELCYQKPKYNFENVNDEIWLNSAKYRPNLKQLIVREANGAQWIILHGYVDYVLKNDRLTIGDKKRNVWCFVQSCFVDKAYANRVAQIIDKNGLQGRCFDENGEIYNIYAGEWYWSKNYHNEIMQYGYEYRPLRLSLVPYKDLFIRPTMTEYHHEYHDDKSKDEGDKIYYPNSHLVEQLNLRLYDVRGIWTNERGEIVLFDNAVSGGQDALIIRMDVLLNYLHLTGQVLIFPILIEKRLHNIHESSLSPLGLSQCGGYMMLDDKGNMRYKIRQYDLQPNFMQRLKYKYIKKYKRYTNSLRKVLIKFHLVKPSERELINIRIEEFLNDENINLNNQK